MERRGARAGKIATSQTATLLDSGGLCRFEMCGLILNYMVQYYTARLDSSFAALADGTRRGVLEQCGHAECSITDLAEMFDMTLTGMRKHVGVLEQAGLVITEKVGRVRCCRIGARRLDEVATWIGTYHKLWDTRFRELDKVVEELKQKELQDGRTKDREAARRTTVERRSDREVIVTRSFDAPVRLVFEAWSNPELFQRWWVPKSMGMTLHACEMDVRTGGTYRLNFGDGMDFFGRYIEVTPPSRIVWTNDEGGENGSVTTVAFEEVDGRTLLVMSELYSSKDALAAEGGAADAMEETFGQLDQLLAMPGAEG